MDFTCPTPQTQEVCLKAFSVICTKLVQEVAELTVPATALGITGPVTVPITVTANSSGIVLNGTLLQDKVVDTGYVPVTVTVGLPTPVTLAFNLPFQTETDCPGACPGDNLQKTPPVIEGVLKPIITPNGTIVGGLPVDTVTFKVIVRTQVTVSREQLLRINATVIGDINPDRCVTVQPTAPTSRTIRFF
ncbi:hypothetical protein [Effusibacillus dendaii]|uniref:Uncharacterized protein n=1 Tax=Effusibacillus dendaii TaxID=2743772 RepID=A0A7I8DJJ9_9BACL|nr:hypothetical protein [Effusibacillus dendaii]BCJ88031.1 hypothetical protein skT53_30160 [Effusibacillus dendaii]